MKKFICLLAIIASFISFNAKAQYYDYDPYYGDFGYSNAGVQTLELTPDMQYGNDVVRVNSLKNIINNLRYYKISISDLYGLDCDDLRVLRNAFYAFHGYIFKSNDLAWFFSQFSWYYPRYRDQGRCAKQMNQTEKYNIGIIKKRERQLGC